MKILILAPFGEGFLADSYARAFETIGHNIFKYDSDEAYFNSSVLAKNMFSRRLFRKYLWAKLNITVLRLVNSLRPDMVLTFKGAFLNPETISRIRISSSIPIVNYYPDNPYCGVPLDPRKTSAQRRDLIECLREYSMVFTWNPQIVERLKHDRVNSFYLPFGVDSYFYNDKNKSNNNVFNEKYNIVLTGLINDKREKHLSSINKFSADVWGVGWERASKVVKRKHKIHPERAFGRDCSTLYKNASVSLNVVDDLNMPGHNMRTFEIPASRGLMLSIYTKEQNQFFPDGEAAFYYHHPSELDEKISFIFKNQSLSYSVRENGYRISQDHTYEKRAIEMLKIVHQS